MTKKDKLLYLLFPLIICIIIFFSCSVVGHCADYSDDIGTIIGDIISDNLPIIIIPNENRGGVQYNDTYNVGYEDSHNNINVLSRASYVYSSVEYNGTKYLCIETVAAFDGSSVVRIGEYYYTVKTIKDAFIWNEMHGGGTLSRYSFVWSDEEFVNSHKNVLGTLRRYIPYDVDLLSNYFGRNPADNYELKPFTELAGLKYITPINPYDVNFTEHNVRCLVPTLTDTRFNGVRIVTSSAKFYMDYYAESQDAYIEVASLYGMNSPDVFGGLPTDYPITLIAPNFDFKIESKKDKIIGITFPDYAYLKFSNYNASDMDIEIRYNMSMFSDYDYDNASGEIIGTNIRSIYDGYSDSQFLGANTESTWFISSQGIVKLAFDMFDGRNSLIIPSDSWNGYLRNPYETICGATSIHFNDNDRKQNTAVANFLRKISMPINPYTSVDVMCRYVQKDINGNYIGCSDWRRFVYNPLRNGQYESSGYFESDVIDSDSFNWTDGEGTSGLNYIPDSSGNVDDPYNSFSNSTDSGFFSFLLDKLGIGKLPQAFNSLFDSLGGIIKTIVNGIGSIPYLIAQIFAWLPSWFNTLFTCSLALVIVLRIIGR